MERPTHVTDARDRFETGAIRGSDTGKSRPDLIDRDFVERLVDLARPGCHVAFHEEQYVKMFNDTLDSNIAELYARLSFEVIEDGPGNIMKRVYVAMLDLGDLLARGAEHYGDNNWRKGIPLWRTKRSLARHFWQWLAGYDDEDHRAAVLFNCMVLYNHLNRRDELPESIFAEGSENG